MAGGTSQNALLELLQHVPEPLRSQVRLRLRKIHLKKSKTLVVEGSLSPEVFFLHEGSAEVTLCSDSGDEVRLRTIRSGAMFGELAILDGKPRSASVVALSDLVVDGMSSKDFMACLDSSPTAGIWLARQLVSSVRRLTEKVFELSALNVAMRVACELLRLADEEGTRCSEGIEVRNAPTHDKLANSVGCNRVGVTKEISALTKAKIISYEERTLVIFNLDALKRAATRGQYF